MQTEDVVPSVLISAQWYGACNPHQSQYSFTNRPQYPLACFLNLLPFRTKNLPPTPSRTQRVLPGFFPLLRSIPPQRPGWSAGSAKWILCFVLHVEARCQLSLSPKGWDQSYRRLGVRVGIFRRCGRNDRQRRNYRAERKASTSAEKTRWRILEGRLGYRSQRSLILELLDESGVHTPDVAFASA